MIPHDFVQEHDNSSQSSCAVTDEVRPGTSSSRCENDISDFESEDCNQTEQVGLEVLGSNLSQETGYLDSGFL
jgi:hypothetical protein